MIPRWYQVEARDAIYRALEKSPRNPVVVLPTGAGKSLVIAEVARDVRKWGGRVLVLAHRKELLEQNAEKLLTIAPDLAHDIGLLSAGLGRKDFEAPILVAGIQSAFRRACEISRRAIVLVDEAHLIPQDGEGMYQTLLTDLRKINPPIRVAGFTATPYRLDCGYVCGPDHFLNEVVYDVPIPILIAEGSLSKLTSKAARASVDTDGVRVRGGEFVAGDLDELCSDSEKVAAACREVVDKCRDRKSVLLFCSGREHAKAVREELEHLLGGNAGIAYLDGETSASERADILARFKAREIRWLVNIDVLTTGFDAPNVDAIALLRPTLSPGLYYQMVGRGLRTSPGKSDCLVLDFGGNVERHGPIDKIAVGPRASSGGTGEAPGKKCPSCSEVVPAGCRTCSACGHEFPPPELKHSTRAANAAIISSELEPIPVMDYWYSIHTKRGAEEGTPRSMRVTYAAGAKTYSEWVCVEHTGFARARAETWWKARCSQPCPTTAEEAVKLGNLSYLAEPLEIVVDESGEFPRIVSVKLGPIPDPDAVFDTEGGRADSEDSTPVSQPQQRNLYDAFDDCPF